MSLRCGIDIVEISRVKAAIENTNERFLNKVYTETEIIYCESKKNSKFESYAAAFCAKEAVAKALGSGISDGVGLKDIEIVHGSSGKPEVFLHKRAWDIFKGSGATEIDISLTHCKDYAVANCVIF